MCGGYLILLLLAHVSQPFLRRSWSVSQYRLIQQSEGSFFVHLLNYHRVILQREIVHRSCSEQTIITVWLKTLSMKVKVSGRRFTLGFHSLWSSRECTITNDWTFATALTSSIYLFGFQATSKRLQLTHFTALICLKMKHNTNRMLNNC